MKAIVTSIGEPTTDLCKWSLERNGFEVTVLENPSILAQKLQAIYKMQEDFLRVDADIIVNKNLTPKLLERLGERRPDIWWWQFVTFDWFKQDVTHSMSFIRKEALLPLRANIGKRLTSLRPETDMSRLDEFHNPRRMETFKLQIMGLHGYGTKDLAKVKRVKKARKQLDLYDFELAERLNEL